MEISENVCLNLELSLDANCGEYHSDVLLKVRLLVSVDETGKLRVYEGGIEEMENKASGFGGVYICTSRGWTVNKDGKLF